MDSDYRYPKTKASALEKIAKAKLVPLFGPSIMSPLVKDAATSELSSLTIVHESSLFTFTHEGTQSVEAYPRREVVLELASKVFRHLCQRLYRFLNNDVTVIVLDAEDLQLSSAEFTAFEETRQRESLLHFGSHDPSDTAHVPFMFRNPPEDSNVILDGKFTPQNRILFALELMNQFRSGTPPTLVMSESLKGVIEHTTVTVPSDNANTTGNIPEDFDIFQESILAKRFFVVHVVLGQFRFSVYYNKKLQKTDQRRFVVREDWSGASSCGSMDTVGIFNNYTETFIQWASPALHFINVEWCFGRPNSIVDLFAFVQAVQILKSNKIHSTANPISATVSLQMRLPSMVLFLSRMFDIIYDPTLLTIACFLTYQYDLGPNAEALFLKLLDRNSPQEELPDLLTDYSQNLTDKMLSVFGEYFDTVKAIADTTVVVKHPIETQTQDFSKSNELDELTWTTFLTKSAKDYDSHLILPKQESSRISSAKRFYASGKLDNGSLMNEIKMFLSEDRLNHFFFEPRLSDRRLKLLLKMLQIRLDIVSGAPSSLTLTKLIGVCADTRYDTPKELTDAIEKFKPGRLVGFRSEVTQAADNPDWLSVEYLRAIAPRTILFRVQPNNINILSLNPWINVVKNCIFYGANNRLASAVVRVLCFYQKGPFVTREAYQKSLKTPRAEELEDDGEQPPREVPSHDIILQYSPGLVGIFPPWVLSEIFYGLSLLSDTKLNEMQQISKEFKFFIYFVWKLLIRSGELDRANALLELSAISNNDFATPTKPSPTKTTIPRQSPGTPVSPNATLPPSSFFENSQDDVVITSVKKNVTIVTETKTEIEVNTPNDFNPSSAGSLNLITESVDVGKSQQKKETMSIAGIRLKEDAEAKQYIGSLSTSEKDAFKEIYVKSMRWGTSSGSSLISIYQDLQKRVKIQLEILELGKQKSPKQSWVVAAEKRHKIMTEQLKEVSAFLARSKRFIASRTRTLVKIPYPEIYIALNPAVVIDLVGDGDVHEPEKKKLLTSKAKPGTVNENLTLEEIDFEYKRMRINQLLDALDIQEGATLPWWRFVELFRMWIFLSDTKSFARSLNAPNALVNKSTKKYLSGKKDVTELSIRRRVPETSSIDEDLRRGQNWQTKLLSSLFEKIEDDTNDRTISLSLGGDAFSYLLETKRHDLELSVSHDSSNSQISNADETKKDNLPRLPFVEVPFNLLTSEKENSSILDITYVSNQLHIDINTVPFYFKRFLLTHKKSQAIVDSIQDVINVLQQKPNFVGDYEIALESKRSFQNLICDDYEVYLKFGRIITSKRLQRHVVFPRQAFQNGFSAYYVPYGKLPAIFPILPLSYRKSIAAGDNFDSRMSRNDEEARESDYPNQNLPEQLSNFRFTSPLPLSSYVLSEVIKPHPRVPNCWIVDLVSIYGSSYTNSTTTTTPNSDEPSLPYIFIFDDSCGLFYEPGMTDGNLSTDSGLWETQMSESTPGVMGAGGPLNKYLVIQDHLSDVHLDLVDERLFVKRALAGSMEFLGTKQTGGPAIQRGQLSDDDGSEATWWPFQKVVDNSKNKEQLPSRTQPWPFKHKKTGDLVFTPLTAINWLTYANLYLQETGTHLFKFESQNLSVNHPRVDTLQQQLTAEEIEKNELLLDLAKREFKTACFEAPDWHYKILNIPQNGRFEPTPTSLLVSESDYSDLFISSGLELFWRTLAVLETFFFRCRYKIPLGDLIQHSFLNFWLAPKSSLNELDAKLLLPKSSVEKYSLRIHFLCSVLYIKADLQNDAVDIPGSGRSALRRNQSYSDFLEEVLKSLKTPIGKQLLVTSLNHIQLIEENGTQPTTPVIFYNDVLDAAEAQKENQEQEDNGCKPPSGSKLMDSVAKLAELKFGAEEGTHLKGTGNSLLNAVSESFLYDDNDESLIGFVEANGGSRFFEQDAFLKELHEKLSSSEGIVLITFLAEQSARCPLFPTFYFSSELTKWTNRSSLVKNGVLLKAFTCLCIYLYGALAKHNDNRWDFMDPKWLARIENDTPRMKLIFPRSSPSNNQLSSTLLHKHFLGDLFLTLFQGVLFSNHLVSSLWGLADNADAGALGESTLSNCDIYESTKSYVLFFYETAIGWLGLRDKEIEEQAKVVNTAAQNKEKQGNPSLNDPYASRSLNISVEKEQRLRNSLASLLKNTDIGSLFTLGIPSKRENFVVLSTFNLLVSVQKLQKAYHLIGQKVAYQLHTWISVALALEKITLSDLRSTRIPFIEKTEIWTEAYQEANKKMQDAFGTTAEDEFSRSSKKLSLPEHFVELFNKKQETEKTAIVLPVRFGKNNSIAVKPEVMAATKEKIVLAIQKTQKKANLPVTINWGELVGKPWSELRKLLQESIVLFVRIELVKTQLVDRALPDEGMTYYEPLVLNPLDFVREK